MVNSDGIMLAFVDSSQFMTARSVFGVLCIDSIKQCNLIRKNFFLRTMNFEGCGRKSCCLMTVKPQHLRAIWRHRLTEIRTVPPKCRWNLLPPELTCPQCLIKCAKGYFHFVSTLPWLLATRRHWMPQFWLLNVVHLLSSITCLTLFVYSSIFPPHSWMRGLTVNNNGY
jgi:hypothetical protein